MNKLLSCPFCKDGGDSRIEPQGTDAAVHCYKCDARGPIIDNGEHYSSPAFETRAKEIQQEAIKAWNTRIPCAQHKQVIAELVAAALSFDEAYRSNVMGPEAEKYKQQQIKGAHRKTIKAIARAKALEVV